MAGVRTGFIVEPSGTQGAVFKKVLEIASGFNIDSAFTNSELGLGIEKDISKTLGVGVYAMSSYGSLLSFKPDIHPAFGISIKF